VLSGFEIIMKKLSCQDKEKLTHAQIDNEYNNKLNPDAVKIKTKKMLEKYKLLA